MLKLTPLILAASVFAGTTGLTDTQKNEVRQLITETIMKDPKIVVNAVLEYRKKLVEDYQKKSASNIAKYQDEIFNKNNKLVLGNPKGSTTIVEFIDYNCGHCRKLSSTLKELTRENSDIKVIVKDLPIFGESSMAAAKAAIAASKQAKFSNFHYAALTNTGKATKENMQQLAQAIGLNMKQFNIDFNSQETKDYIEANKQLAQKLNIMATPAMIIQANKKNTFISGALPKSKISEIISKLK